MKKIYFLLFLLIIFLSCAKNQESQIKPAEILVTGNGDDISSFYMFQFELTIKEYKQYLQITQRNFDFSEWKCYEGSLNDMAINDSSPMVNLSFLEVVEFANWLSLQQKLTPAYKITADKKIEWILSANGYRIPSSKEWEWAARGGLKTKGFSFPGSDILDEVAWSSINAEGKLQPVGLKKPNELGLYDIFGNASEWCWDIYCVTTGKTGFAGEFQLPNGEYTHPVGEKQPINEIFRLTRGGSFITLPEWFSYKKDYFIYPEALGCWIGIRLVRNTN